MESSAEWDARLEAADSVGVLAPEGYDDDAAEARVKALQVPLSRSLAGYRVSTIATQGYQDGTAMASCRITARDADSASMDSLAWIVFSHFGTLATVADCVDGELLATIRRVLEGLNLAYVDYDYAARMPYDGKCGLLTGLSWANRYFALVPEYNSSIDGLSEAEYARYFGP